MTNLEWIRTLSAKELSDLLYDYWLPRGQYVWTDSRKGLVKVLDEKYLERDCDKCKRQDNCYCVKGLDCPFEPRADYKKWDVPPKVEIPTTITTCVSVLASAFEDEPQLTTKCLNCVNSGSYKCSKCDGEMYFKDRPQMERSE